jgi:hypothetical protein
MVGREISDLFPRRRSKLGASALEIENLMSPILIPAAAFLPTSIFRYALVKSSGSAV